MGYAELTQPTMLLVEGSRPHTAFTSHHTGERNGLRAAPHFLHHHVDTHTPT
ncbi:hypothetical protein GCM10010872_37920 [Dyella flava]|nr:hypothetical protein GCM10010872_37920 [Dyella flava]